MDVEQAILDSIINQGTIEQQIQKKISDEEECQKVKYPNKNSKVQLNPHPGSLVNVHDSSPLPSLTTIIETPVEVEPK